MSKKFESDSSNVRYIFIAIIMTLVAIVVLGKGFVIMTTERSYWMAVDSLHKPRLETVPAVRGNILACNGQRLACNLPEYEMHIDFVALQEGKADTLWHNSEGKPTKELLALCQGLSEILHDKTPSEYLEYLEEGYAAHKRYYPVVKYRVDYDTFKKIKALPIFRLKPGLSGFKEDEHIVRKSPYGTLANCLIGNIYKSSGVAYSGLELVYDSLLRGHPGIKHKQKELDTWINVLDKEPANGCDIITTLDVGIQDLASRALEKEMRKDNAYTGVAIVMEVATGDIKAMVNFDHNKETGEYEEVRNHAIADFLEPGSVFKTASFLVALDDGKIDTTMSYDTGCGIKEMYGAKMKDHNWAKGGYQVLTVPQILQKSSNIGVSALIDKYYHSNPEKFVKGIHRVGMAEDLKLPFPEYRAPRVRMPERDKYGNWTANWSNTALPWMSIGYETQMPPITVLTFYNAIANNGVMVAPRFVTRVMRNDEVIQEFPVKVLKEKIVQHDEALKQMQEMLVKVVSLGLGKTAGSKLFSVAGKTGTAQKASGGGYKNGVTNYLLSFAGYFPADNPQYSCIVCLQKAGLPASGGTMSGQVFHDIAEGIMAKDVFYGVKSAHTSQSTKMPDVKSGNVYAADYVLTQLGFEVEDGWKGTKVGNKPVWGRVERHPGKEKIITSSGRSRYRMPDVRGMGARDAVYILEERGMKVTLKGSGKVKSQSKAAGSVVKKGDAVTLELQ